MDVKNSSVMNNSTIFKNGNNFKWKMESMATFGGAGISVFCAIMLIVILCILVNIKKRLKRLEKWYTKYKKDQTQKQPLAEQASIVSQPSIRSNVPADIDNIPIVSRRSEYIRQGKLTEDIKRRFVNRVSRIFTFGSTPRSSADTFDLSKPDESIYDDIMQFRKSELPDKVSFCCCCKVKMTYEKTRTSDPQPGGGKSGETEEPRNISTGERSGQNESKEIKDPPEKKNGILSKKKEQNTQETEHTIDVQHVEFDEREKYYQPANADDVAIGLQQKPIKQINKELISFGKKTSTSPQLPEKPQIVPRPEKSDPPTKFSTIAGHGKKIRGIQLPFPFPVKHGKSLPSVNEETINEKEEATGSTETKERDPSYIDMKETLKVPPLPEKRGKLE